MSSSSSSSSAALGGVALAATAMALSGTLVLFSLCRAKQTADHLVSSDAGDASPARLRPCLSSAEKRKREKARRGSMKRVRFAADVVDNGAGAARPATPEKQKEKEAPGRSTSCRASAAAMPANREALYRSMLRGRSMLRTACSY